MILRDTSNTTKIMKKTFHVEIDGYAINIIVFLCEDTQL